jgi:hypothetical protein
MRAVIPFSDSDWRKELSKVPSERELLAQHKAFKKNDFTQLSISSIKAKFFEHYHLFPLYQEILEAQHFNRSGLFRARWIDSRLEDIKNQSNHSYPPPARCASYGRANLPHRPVLYLAEDPWIAILEIGPRPSPNHNLFITRWEVQWPRVRFYPILPGFAAGGSSSEVNEAVRIRMKNWLQHQRSGRVDTLILLSELWSDLFLSDFYEVTGWMSDHVLYRKYPEFDAIVYPSVVKKRHGACFAIPPRFVDEGSIQMVASIGMEVESYLFLTPNERVRMRVVGLSEALPDGKRFNWRPIDNNAFIDRYFPRLLKHLESHAKRQPTKSGSDS